MPNQNQKFSLRPVYVFFTETHTRVFSLHTSYRLLTRRPRTAVNLFLEWMIVKLSRSSIAHCSIGHDGVVLDPVHSGDRFWPFQAYVRKYPRIKGCFIIPAPHPIDLTRYEDRPVKPVWRTFAKWATRGLISTTDCVCTTKDVLAQLYIHCPRSVTTPIKLYRWLHAKKYCFEPFDDPDDERATD